MTTPLSHSRDDAIVIATRTASGISVIGSAFIISTFIYFPFFRKRTFSYLTKTQGLIMHSDQSSGFLRDFRQHLDQHSNLDVKRSITEGLRTPIRPMRASGTTHPMVPGLRFSLLFIDGHKCISGVFLRVRCSAATSSREMVYRMQLWCSSSTSPCVLHPRQDWTSSHWVGNSLVLGSI
jgi:hypothetical protein